MRHSLFNGSFYESDFTKLDKQIKECFLSRLGPGDLPVKRKDGKKLFGVIVPHAGYQFSGACAAWAYKEIAESKLSTYVILGTVHSFYSSGVFVSLQDWQTPFGDIKVDVELGKELMKKCRFIKSDEKAHINEHSIEVQLPFLQFVSKDVLSRLRILPIAISDLSSYEKIGPALKEIEKDVCIIASSDFTHFGPNYGYTPFKYQLKESLQELDKGAIDLIRKMDTKSFLEYVKKSKITICGTGPIVTAISICKSLGSSSVSLLNYYTSGDVIGDFNNSVSYASLSFR